MMTNITFELFFERMSKCENSCCVSLIFDWYTELIESSQFDIIDSLYHKLYGVIWSSFAFGIINNSERTYLINLLIDVRSSRKKAIIMANI